MNAPEDQAGLLPETKKATEPAHMLARINSMAIKMVYPFIASEDIRYYLNGVNIRPLDAGGVMVTATDGHRFIIVRDPNGYAEKELIVSVCKDAIKHASTQHTFDVMSNGAAMWNDQVTTPLFLQPGNSIIEGEYPRIESVVDVVGYKEGISGAVNANYLADVAKIKIGASTPAIRFFTKDADSPLLFIFDGIGDMECIGGIMKLRDSFNLLPDWLPERSEFSLSKQAA